MRGQVLAANVVVFIASFCTLVIELVAGRILAPYVGVSLYTWTSIIGVVLAGISVGAYLGGIIADRYPSHKTLGWLLFLSGVSAFTIPPLMNLLGEGEFLRQYIAEKLDITIPLMARVLILTVAVFFVPSTILGMISPVVVKLTVQNLETTGNVVGKIYAFSTLGSILGTFATGFFLIEWVGTRTLIFIVGAVLVACAPLFGTMGRGRPHPAALVACLIFLPSSTGLLYAKSDAFLRAVDLFSHALFVKESNYYTIRVSESEDFHRDTNQPIELRKLVLDHLVHSYTSMDDPTYLHYEYLRIYEEIIAWRQWLQKKTDADYTFDILFIGGGGYTLPRYIDHVYPRARVDVVEIDPWVSRVAEKYLDIEQRRIRTYNEDGRWYVMNCKDRKYDFIIMDAFNDLAIPYHLTTREYNAHLKRLLKPDGLVMALVIDNIGKGRFLPSYMTTLWSVFDHLNLIVMEDWELEQIGHTTCIVVAGERPFDSASFRRFLKERQDRGKEAVSRVVDEPKMIFYLNSREPKPILLTDDYVPVDNLIAPLFEERFGYRRQHQ
ncbi:MAG: hypothetical protein C4296_10890 [Gemmataceae bacterium]